MFTFAFQYKNEDFPIEFEHVVRAEYQDGDELVTVAEGEMNSHRFPLDRPIYLFSSEESFCASPRRLRYIQVTDEG